MTSILFILGLVLLVVGAELLVRGAAQLALRGGISPLVIGLTVVAFGTSAPEMAVSVKGALDGQEGIAIGNVVGSNIFNVLLILGLSAAVVPLAVASQLLRFDVPLMIAVSCLMLAMGWDGSVSRGEGALLFAGILAYTGAMVYFGRRGAIDVSPTEDLPLTPGRLPLVFDLAFVVVGLLLLVLGSRWLVQSAVEFAQWMGVSDLVIGLTVVAAGTSLPELMTSLMASLRGQRDIAVGNVVGSNLFNILAVLGLSAVAAPQGMAVAPAALAFDIPVMIGVAVVCLPIFFTGGEIARWEGLLLVGFYLAYTTYLVMAATEHDALNTFGTIMLWFVIPLVALTLAVLSLQWWRRKRGSQPS
jgi:cation:H+ antiporter